MPGTYVIDQGATFAAALLMSSAPKDKFGEPGRQDTASDGTPKWAVNIAVTFTSQNGIAPASEVLAITITSPSDPGAGIPVGSPVSIEGLRVGINVPERRGEKIVGGKIWHSATGLRSAAASLRPVKGGEQAS